MDPETQSGFFAGTKEPADLWAAGFGNASATYTWSTGNPAALGWQAGETEKEGKQGYLTGTYAFTSFERGPELHLGGASVFYALDNTSAIELTYASTSGGFENDMGIKYDLDRSHALGVAYGREIAPGLYAGARAGASFDKETLQLSGVGDMETRSTLWNGRLGVLWLLPYEFKLGGDATYYHQSSKDRFKTTGAILKDSLDFDAMTSRVGISWTSPWKTTLATDVQLVHIFGGGTRVQPFVGIEQEITDWLWIRGGYADRGWTAGAEAYVKTEKFSGGVVVGFMDNPFRELNDTLGKANVIGATLYVYF